MSEKDKDLKSEAAFRMILRALTADNMCVNLSNALATGNFSKAKNYFSAMAKSLEIHGDEYKVKDKWENLTYQIAKGDKLTCYEKILKQGP